MVHKRRKKLNSKLMSAIWPNFFIGGVTKSGTTSLYEYLRQHPQVFMSAVKAPCFFSRMAQKHVHQRITQEQEYLKLFRGAESAKAIGEASADYLWDETAPYRIREKIPNAKNILILRDPIDRAYSHYLHKVRFGVEGCSSFYDALFGEHGHYYVAMGLYFSQVKRYFGVFGRDQVLVLMFEDLKRKPIDLLNNIADFLGIDREPFRHILVDVVHNPYMTPKNRLVHQIFKRTVFIRCIVNWMLRNRALRDFYLKVFRPSLFKYATKPPMDQKAVKFLQMVYERDVADLEQLLGRPLPDLRKVWDKPDNAK